MMRPQISYADVHGLMVAMNNKGVEFFPAAPDVYAVAPTGVLSASDRALLVWYGPFIFALVISLMRAQGHHFCVECSIKLHYDTPPAPGEITICPRCHAGELSHARLVQFARDTVGPRPWSLN